MAEFLGNSLNGCIMPEGAYLDSCYNIDVYEYISKDKQVSSMCVLEAVCDSGSDNSVDIENKIFFPKHTHFTALSNKNGILTYGNNPVSFEMAIKKPEVYALAMETLEKAAETQVAYFEEAAAFDEDSTEIRLISDKPHVFELPKFEFKRSNCNNPSGSYINSCSIKTAPYTSTDKNLTYVELCKAEILCAGVSGDHADSKIVYFNINDKVMNNGAPKTVQKIENCNGHLIIGNLDNQCKGMDEALIKNKGEKEGKKGSFRV